MDNKQIKTLYIFGAGGHAKVVASALQRNILSETCLFFDSGRSLENETILGIFPITSEAPNFNKEDAAHVAIGCNHTRKKISEENPLLQWPVIIHPSAEVHESAIIGPGTFIGPKAVINPDAKIGAHCIINSGAILEHDCEIGSYVHIAPGTTLCGGVNVGDLTLVGAGTIVIPNIQIGKECLIGAGSVIVRDVEEGRKFIKGMTK